MQPRKRWVEMPLPSSQVVRAMRYAAFGLLMAVAAACSGSPTAPIAGRLSSEALAGDGQLAVQAAHLTPEDFAARGWECRASPVPGRTACSRPHQGFPAVPPPADRPASYTLLVWQDGVFDGTVILIRPDLYRGQPCESTPSSPGESRPGPYIFRPVIGYYECHHSVGS